ncbi:MAG: hypothetical protein QOG75_6399, partial [Mycobacterium sp.]|nr:hypothetical protein [Mycobacterium sp.]
MPGGPVHDGSGIAAAARARLHPTPGDNRHKGMANNGCCNHEAAA